MLHTNSRQYHPPLAYHSILSHHCLHTTIYCPTTTSSHSSLSLSSCSFLSLLSLYIFITSPAPPAPLSLTPTRHKHKKEALLGAFEGGMEYYMDEKWKLSKEDRPHSSSKPSISRSVSQRSTTKSSLQKSFSQRNPFNLSRSTSQKNTSSKSSLPRSSSHKCSDFSRKCTNLAKEQKAKFYIVKRCISMLVSWKKNGDS